MSASASLLLILVDGTPKPMVANAMWPSREIWPGTPYGPVTAVTCAARANGASAPVSGWRSRWSRKTSAGTSYAGRQLPGPGSQPEYSRRSTPAVRGQDRKLLLPPPVTAIGRGCRVQRNDAQLSRQYAGWTGGLK